MLKLATLGLGGSRGEEADPKADMECMHLKHKKSYKNNIHYYKNAHLSRFLTAFSPGVELGREFRVLKTSMCARQKKLTTQDLMPRV